MMSKETYSFRLIPIDRSKVSSKNPDFHHKAIRSYFLLHYLYSQQKIREAVLEILSFYRPRVDKALNRINQVKPLLECSDEILLHIEKCLREGDFYARRGRIFYSRNYTIDSTWDLLGLATITSAIGLASWIILEKGTGLNAFFLWANEIIKLSFLLMTIILAILFLLELGKFLVFRYLSRKNLALITVSLKMRNLGK